MRMPKEMTKTNLLDDLAIIYGLLLVFVAPVLSVGLLVWLIFR